MAAAATARAQPVPARAPRRKHPVPARPKRTAPARRHGGQLIPLAVGTASAVRGLPDSSLIVRLTRGRAWIAVLGVLLVGIVALNVVTLSLAADVGHIDENVQALSEENSLLGSRDAQRSGAGRIAREGAELGLSAASLEEAGVVRFSPRDFRIAAQRLAAAGAGY